MTGAVTNTHPAFPHLCAFYARWSRLAPEFRTAALRGACDAGDGTWTAPVLQPGVTAATHLHEVMLHQVYATGDTPDQAARNWFDNARDTIASVDAALGEAARHRQTGAAA